MAPSSLAPPQTVGLRSWTCSPVAHSRLWAKASVSPPRLPLAPDGEVLASGKDNAVILWDLTDGIDKAVLQAGTGRSGKRLAFRPGGDRLATIVDGAETVVWELQTESVSAVLSRQTEAVTEVAYNADGRFLAHQAQIGQRIRTKELNSCAS
jgi:WD40 repeat protein